MPTRKLVATLTGRQLELVGQAGDRLVLALQQIQEAQQRGLELELRLQEALEMATGDKDPKTLIVDRGTGEVFREVQPTRKGRRGKPNRGGRKTGGRKK